MKINNNRQLQNPVLYYKLDPGEPGLATPTRASQSIAKVAAHEATNIRRFKREAMEKGGYVVYSFIGLNLEQRGAFLAATSGISKALIIIPEDKNKKNNDSFINKKINDDSNDKEKLNDQLKINKDDKEKKDQNNINIKNFVTDEIGRIDKIIDRLKNEKLSLENQTQTKNDNVDNNIATDNEKKDNYREIQLNEIDKRIQYLEQKKEMEKQKEFFNNLANTRNLSLKLVGLIYNNSSLNINGELINTIV